MTLSIKGPKTAPNNDRQVQIFVWFLNVELNKKKGLSFLTGHVRLELILISLTVVRSDANGRTLLRFRPVGGAAVRNEGVEMSVRPSVYQCV